MPAPGRRERTLRLRGAGAAQSAVGSRAKSPFLSARSLSLCCAWPSGRDRPATRERAAGGHLLPGVCRCLLGPDTVRPARKRRGSAGQNHHYPCAMMLQTGSRVDFIIIESNRVPPPSKYSQTPSIRPVSVESFV